MTPLAEDSQLLQTIARGLESNVRMTQDVFTLATTNENSVKGLEKASDALKGEVERLSKLMYLGNGSVSLLIRMATVESSNAEIKKTLETMMKRQDDVDTARTQGRWALLGIFATGAFALVAALIGLFVKH